MTSAYVLGNSITEHYSDLNDRKQELDVLLILVVIISWFPVHTLLDRGLLETTLIEY